MNKLIIVALLVGLGFVSSAKAEDEDRMHDACMSLDTNKDNMISKEEFMAYHEKMFNEHDKEGKGMLTADHMKKMCHGMKKHDEDAKGSMEETHMMPGKQKMGN